MARIAIVVGHARRDTFCEALANAYRHGAESAGHSAQVFVLSKMTFDPILHEGFEGVQALEPDLRDAQQAIGAANHLVIVFPLWFGSLPAILKGFFERTFQLGFAIERTRGPMHYRPLLTGKSARVIMTMGMPAAVYRWYFGAHALKMLRRHILAFVGIRPVRATLYGGVDAASTNRRRRWIGEVEELGRAAH
jgi:NAD(P)H dehydrogenase (quinone)